MVGAVPSKSSSASRVTLGARRNAGEIVRVLRPTYDALVSQIVIAILTGVGIVYGIHVSLGGQLRADMKGLFKEMARFGERMARIEERFASFHERVAGIEERLTGVEGRLVSVEERLVRTFEYETYPRRSASEVFGRVARHARPARTRARAGPMLMLFRDKL